MIPVTILTGFLGAGKTTFLNALIQFNKERGRTSFVIENEFGAEGIDSELVVGVGNGIFEFNNGCLCCDLNQDLFDLLSELWKMRDQFDELIIETTGIADPATVAIPFLTNPSLGEHYRLARVIGLVDGKFIESELAETKEARKQIVFSDILLINKTEDLAAGREGHIRALLQNINPFARVLAGNKTSGYPLEEITRFFRDVDPAPATDAGSSGQHHHHHHHDITSLSFRFAEPFDVEALEYRLLVFLMLQAKNIYRVKGILYGYGREKKIIVQSVAHLLAVSEGEEWKSSQVRESRIVFIGKDLQPKGFEKLLRDCMYRENKRVNFLK